MENIIFIRDLITIFYKDNPYSAEDSLVIMLNCIISLNMTLLINFNDCFSLSETANNGIRFVSFAFINV